MFSAAFRWVDGRLAHVVSSADITDNKRNEALVEYLANYDSLTNLPNRRMLVKECERRIDKTQEGGEGYLLFFDIDGFKKINDTFGHEAGDEFLVQLGQFFPVSRCCMTLFTATAAMSSSRSSTGIKRKLISGIWPALSIGGLPSPGG